MTSAVVVCIFSVAFAQAYLVKSQQQIDQVRSEVVEAKNVQARIQRQVDAASAPGSIIDGADQLGMIRAGEPTHLAATRALPAAAPETPQAGVEGVK